MSSNTPLAQRRVDVGIVGTFDVENYGDLLFPLIAQSSLQRRLPSVQVVPFSPNARLDAAWPYRVYSTIEFAERLPSLSALLIGGGQIVRFDKGYPVQTDPVVNLPVDYWLMPAVLGTLAGKPVIWNAVGAWTGSPLAPQYTGAAQAAFAASYYVGLRDEASCARIRDLAPATDIRLLPDTAFSLSRLWPLENPSPEYSSWRDSQAVDGRYVVVQADRRLEEYRAAIESLVSAVGVRTVVVLPVCRCHGDESAGFANFACDQTILCSWLSPRLICEIIARSEFVIVSSLHASITAISYGVPVVRVPSFNFADRKFEMLNPFEGVATIGEHEKQAGLIRRGRRIEPLAIEYADQLERYWDLVADAVMHQDQSRSDQSLSKILAWVASTLARIGTEENQNPDLRPERQSN
jgi:polysaccharide pyruvyl transferase WcaK-like protein